MLPVSFQESILKLFFVYNVPIVQFLWFQKGLLD